MIILQNGLVQFDEADKEIDENARNVINEVIRTHYIPRLQVLAIYTDIYKRAMDGLQVVSDGVQESIEKVNEKLSSVQPEETEEDDDEEHYFTGDVEEPVDNEGLYSYDF